MAEILDKQGYRIMSRIRQLMGRLRAKPDKFKLDSFYEQIVVEIEDLSERIAKLEDARRGAE